MNTIPTAEAFLEESYGLFEDTLSGDKFADNVSPKSLIQFAKMHVIAALEAASEKAVTNCDEGGELGSVNKDSILHAYPESLIK